VALAAGSQVSLQGNEVGGGTLGEGYTSKAVDEALVHLNEGLRLAPQDVSIHEGRLHVLEVSGRFDEMVKALDESATIYKGEGTPDIWLAYAAELGDMGEPTAGLRFCEVLDRHYPNNSNIIGNVGALHNMLKQWDLGLPYERRAVELNPTDPIDTWNLGWTLDHLGQDQEADKWMSKAMQLGAKSEDLTQRKCLYGQFLVRKMNKKSDGCALVQANCEEGDRSVCSEAPATNDPK
jgi:tetratricopeptide (TPR) repeat protein